MIKSKEIYNCRALSRGKVIDSNSGRFGLDNIWVSGTYVESLPMIMENGRKGFHKGWIIPISGFYSNGGFFNTRLRYPVDEKTVGMFTGLFDKDGNHLFEDDIIRYNGRIFYVEYDYECFQYILKDNANANTLYSEDKLNYDCFELWRLHTELITVDRINFEIIGNIWDNPDIAKDLGITDIEN